LVLEYLQNTYSPHGQQDHITMPLDKTSSKLNPTFVGTLGENEIIDR